MAGANRCIAAEEWLSDDNDASESTVTAFQEAVAILSANAL
jgi:hypothetical protein